MAAEPDPHPTLLVLHALRVAGFVDLEPMMDRTGLPAEDVRPVLDHLVERGLARRRDGRVAGWVLTTDGQFHHRDRLADATVELARPEIELGYRQFVGLNDELKQLCTDWQALGDRAATQAALAGFAARADPITARLGATVPWMAGYRERLDRAAQRFADGDDTALTRPLSGSYHDVWMELHQDLLLTLGRERDAADGH